MAIAAPEHGLQGGEQDRSARVHSVNEVTEMHRSKSSMTEEHSKFIDTEICLHLVQESQNSGPLEATPVSAML